jgi:hypothetical protein
MSTLMTLRFHPTKSQREAGNPNEKRDTKVAMQRARREDIRRRWVITLLLLLSAMTLTSCVTEPTEAGYRQVMDGWIGQTGEKLITSRGKPGAQQVRDDGTKVYEYVTTSRYTISYTTTERVWVESHYVGQTMVSGHYVDAEVPGPPETRQGWCDTTFYLTPDETIKSYDFSGPDCTAYEKQAD